MSKTIGAECLHWERDHGVRPDKFYCIAHGAYIVNGKVADIPKVSYDLVCPLHGTTSMSGVSKGDEVRCTNCHREVMGVQ